MDNHECPFAASSIELVKLLGEILGRYLGKIRTGGLGIIGIYLWK